MSEAVWTPRNLILLAAILVFFGVLFWGVYRIRFSQIRQEYEGRIVEKWAGYGETDIGSQPYFRLLIENDNKHRFTVVVLPEIYQRAEVGMRIKKTKSGVEIIADEAKVIR